MGLWGSVTLLKKLIGIKTVWQKQRRNQEFFEGSGSNWEMFTSFFGHRS